MRSISFLIFFCIVLLIYSTVNYYLFVRGLQAFSLSQPMRRWYIVGFWIADTPMICKGTETKIEVADYFDTYLWNTGETKSSIMVSKEGIYWVRGTTTRNCQKSDSVYIKVNDPVMDLGKDTSSCEPGTIVFDAGKDFETYKWQDESTKQTFTVYKTGYYTVTGWGGGDRL